MRLIMTEDEISKIHNKYYCKKIQNVRGHGNIENAMFVNPFYFYTHPNDTCIADCLKTGVLFEKFILSFVEQFIDPNKNILDIGANIGVHSVVYSNYLKDGTVYSFEPQKVVYDLLVLNLDVNNCKNAVAYNFGASNIDDTFYMNAHYDSKDNQGAFKICSKEESSGLSIQCKRIDDLKIDNVGYIKIDVEGHEYETLLGMKTLLHNNKPNLLIEIHNSSPTKHSVFELLENVGYNEYIRLSHCDYFFTTGK